MPVHTQAERGVAAIHSAESARENHAAGCRKVRTYLRPGRYWQGQALNLVAVERPSHEASGAR